MALTAVRTFIAGQILYASQLNREFSNIYTNGEDMFTPAAKVHDMDGFELVLDADGDTSITADSDDQIDLKAQGVDLWIFDATQASAVNALQFTAGLSGTDVGITVRGSTIDKDVDISAAGTGLVMVEGQDAWNPIAHEMFAEFDSE